MPYATFAYKNRQTKCLTKGTLFQVQSVLPSHLFWNTYVSQCNLLRSNLRTMQNFHLLVCKSMCKKNVQKMYPAELSHKGTHKMSTWGMLLSPSSFCLLHNRPMNLRDELLRQGIDFNWGDSWLRRRQASTSK